MGVGIRHVVPCGDVQEMSKKTGEAVILHDGSESEVGRARQTAHLFVTRRCAVLTRTRHSS